MRRICASSILAARGSDLPMFFRPDAADEVLRERGIAGLAAAFEGDAGVDFNGDAEGESGE